MNRRTRAAPELSVEEFAHILGTLFATIEAKAVPGWLLLDVSISQLKTLFILSRQGALTVTRLAHELEIGKPAASILIQQMVERGLIERTEDPADRRRSIVRLSAQGSNLIAGRRKDRRVLFRSWLGQLNDDERASLMRGMRALARVVPVGKQNSVERGSQRVWDI